MKQNKQKGSIAIQMILLVLFSMLVPTMLAIKMHTNDISRLEKYDTCLTQAITVNPDPNDTTERSILLANCMNK